MTGISRNIYDETWATLSAMTALPTYTDNTSQPGQPLARLEELLAVIPLDRVIFVDPKAVLATETNALLDFLEAHAAANGYTAQGRFVVKQFRGTGVAQANIAKSRGYTTWGIYYDGEITASPVNDASFDILGMNFNASTGNWAAAKAFGKPVLGHVIANTGQAATANSRGADGLMTSTTANVPYDGAPATEGAVGLTVAVNGTAVKVTSATGHIAATVDIDAVAVKVTSVTGACAIALDLASSVVKIGAAGGTVTLHANVVGDASKAEWAEATGTSSVLVDVTASVSSSATVAGSLDLTVSLTGDAVGGDAGHNITVTGTLTAGRHRGTLTRRSWSGYLTSQERT